MFRERFADNLVLSLLDARAMLVMTAELYGEGKNKTKQNHRNKTAQTILQTLQFSVMIL